MTRNRKAELQRKLSMAPVTKPPAGLLDRLKADIPDNLMSVEPDRTRLSRSMSFTLRIAASVLILVTSAFLGMKFLSRGELSQDDLASERRSRLDAPVISSPVAEVAIENAPAASNQSVEAPELKQAAPKESMLLDRVDPARKRQAVASAREETEATSAASVANDAFAGDVRGAVDTTVAQAPPSAGIAAPAAVAAPLEKQADAVADAAAATSESVPGRRNSTVMAVSRPAAKALSTTPRTLFGLSIDPHEFGRLKRLIESGEKPAAASVNINALVNHFSGQSSPRRMDVQLQIEGSRAPLPPQGMVIRYTIDTAARDTSVGSTPMIGSAAVLDITLNPKVVESHRVLADGASLRSSEQTLAANVSATGLVEIRLKPGVSDRQNVATIRLKYRSFQSGDQVTLSDSIDVRELRRSWLDASRRHRLATLGAVWGESLNGPPPAKDVARKAEELATEEPGDAQAKDLAAAATASSRLRSSGPTGSER